MNKIIEKLVDGLKIGPDVYMDVEIRNETVGDMVAALSDAEKLVTTPDGYELVSNPAMVGLLSLGRQIVRIGDLAGPIDIDNLKKLSTIDLEIIRGAADGLTEASLKKVKNRGRPSASSE